MKKLIYVSFITTSIISGMANIPHIPDIQMPTLQNIVSLNIPNLDVKLTGIANLKLPNLGKLLNNMPKINLPDFIGNLSGLSKLTMPNLSLTLGKMPSVGALKFVNNLSAITKLPNVKVPELNQHLPAIAQLSDLGVPLPQLQTIVVGALSKGQSIGDFLASMPQVAFDKFASSFTPPDAKKDALAKLKKLKKELAAAQKQIAAFDAGTYDPTPATDIAELKKLEAQLKVVEGTITTNTKKVPALKKTIGDATGDLDKLNNSLQKAYTKAGGDLNITKVEVEYNLLGAMSGTQLFGASVTIELYGKEYTVKVDSFDIKNIGNNVKPIVEKVKEIIQTHPGA
ncbi:MAG TPA: hypothetical protein QGF02_04780 [Candidatus Babeliales bacterium]|nr:hypothetical protein [Candidatus Babeliales bacterium]